MAEGMIPGQDGDSDMNTTNRPLDPRIGTLNGGAFYAFANGHDKPEVRGTLEEVEAALGLRPVAPKATRARAARPEREYSATITDPSGYRAVYRVTAESRADARKKIGDLYRLGVPAQAKAHGFYAFSSCVLTWNGEG